MSHSSTRGPPGKYGARRHKTPQQIANKAAFAARKDEERAEKKAQAERVQSVVMPILQRRKIPTEEITIDTLLVELEEARNLAVVTGQAAAMRSCTMGKAELLGYLVQRTETGAPGEFSHVRTREEAYDLIEQKYGPHGLAAFKEIMTAMETTPMLVDGTKADDESGSNGNGVAH